MTRPKAKTQCYSSVKLVLGSQIISKLGNMSSAIPPNQIYAEMFVK